MGISRNAGVGRRFLIGLLCVSGPLMAAEPPPGGTGVPAPRPRAAATGVELRVGGTRSDNIDRVNTDGAEDTMATIGAAIDIAHDGRVLDVDARGDIDWVEYLDNTYDARVIGSLNALANLDFIPERFSWRAQETFGQLETDPFGPTTPESLENVSYFTTGPVFQFGLGSVARVVLGATYSMTQYETSPLDSDRYGGSVGLVRPLSNASSVSLNVTGENIKFDEEESSNYDRNSAFVTYEMLGARTGINADLGYTQISPDIGEEQSGLLARISMQRQMSSSMSLSAFVLDQFSDSSDVFRAGADSRNLGREAYGVATAEALEERGAGAGWSYIRARTSLGLGATWTEEIYENTPALDRKVTGLQASFQRRLGPVTTFMVEVRRDDEKFETSGLDDQELTVRSELRWNIGRRAGAGLRYERFDRDSNNPLTEFTENRYGLNFYWRAVAAER